MHHYLIKILSLIIIISYYLRIIYIVICRCRWQSQICNVEVVFFMLKIIIIDLKNKTKLFLANIVEFAQCQGQMWAKIDETRSTFSEIRFWLLWISIEEMFQYDNFCLFKILNDLTKFWKIKSYEEPRQFWSKVLG